MDKSDCIEREIEIYLKLLHYIEMDIEAEENIEKTKGKN